MKISKWNKTLGWFWMALTVAIGMYSAMNVGEWASAAAQGDEAARMTRTFVRHAHTMGIVGAVINVAYGYRIDKVPLGSGTRAAGGVLALLGMVGVTLVWPGMLVGVPEPTAALVGVVLILAMVILGYGELKT